jgi:hypothetical protein
LTGGNACPTATRMLKCPKSSVRDIAGATGQEACPYAHPSYGERDVIGMAVRKR